MKKNSAPSPHPYLPKFVHVKPGILHFQFEDFRISDDGEKICLEGSKEEGLQVSEIQRLGLFDFRVGPGGIRVLYENFDADNRIFTLRVNGRRVQVRVQDFLDDVAARTGAVRPGAKRAQSLRSPMPGLVSKILIQAGAPVRKGDTLLILEAMKMENAIKAPADTVVDAVLCEAGQSVEKGSVLVRFRES
ncbi:MAG: biotin/lipoyl-binding protein [Flavobacteriales bacterium]|nr:biotin/lipoyl-binding protein [Flavobacteriales bacterium]MDW8432805.1 biotin/lipoyl-containing protein [Flavobacteriales bacterium]